MDSKEMARRAVRLATLARLRAEIAELKKKELRTEADDDVLEALEAWERQVAYWLSRM